MKLLSIHLWFLVLSHYMGNDEIVWNNNWLTSQAPTSNRLQTCPSKTLTFFFITYINRLNGHGDSCTLVSLPSILLSSYDVQLNQMIVLKKKKNHDSFYLICGELVQNFRLSAERFEIVLYQYFTYAECLDLIFLQDILHYLHYVNFVF